MCGGETGLDVLADHFGAPFIKTTLNYSRAPRANPQAWAIPHYNHAVSAAVAQWIEYWPPKPRVVGSIPASRTIFCIANTASAFSCSINQRSAHAGHTFLLALPGQRLCGAEPWRRCGLGGHHVLLTTPAAVYAFAVMVARESPL
jgi:hypothetical protein